MQFITIGKELFRGARKAEELAGADAGGPTLRTLKQVEAFRKRGAPRSEVQALVGMSRAAFCS